MFNHRPVLAGVLGSLLAFALLEGCHRPRTQGANSPGQGIPPAGAVGGQPALQPMPLVKVFYGSSPGSYGSTVTVHAKARAFLSQLMGVGDREANSWGLASCESWLNGTHQVWFEIPNVPHPQELHNKTGILTVAVQPKTNPYAWYWGSFPSGTRLIGCLIGFCLPNYQAYLNPIKLQLRLQASNQQAGVVGIGYPSYGTQGWQSSVMMTVSSIHGHQTTGTLFYGNEPVYDGVFISQQQ